MQGSKVSKFLHKKMKCKEVSFQNSYFEKMKCKEVNFQNSYFDKMNLTYLIPYITSHLPCKYF